MLSRDVSQPQPGLSLRVIRKAKRDVSDEVVAGRATMLDAVRLCIELAPVADNVICEELGIDAGQWSRIKSGSAHFPTNKYLELMEACGNEVPLRWLAYQRGYGLVRLKSEVEIENERLKAELQEERRKNETITEFMRQVKA